MLIFYITLNTIENPDEKQILEMLFIKYEKMIFRYILSRYNFPFHDTEDLTAQTFLLMVKYKHKFIGETEERQLSLLICFARCSCINYQKKTALEDQHFISWYSVDDTDFFNPAESKDPVDFAEGLVQKEYDQQCIKEARNIIARLPSPTREILLMKTDAGMNSSEIGAILHMPPATVRTIATRTYRKIRKELFYDKSKKR